MKKSIFALAIAAAFGLAHAADNTYGSGTSGRSGTATSGGRSMDSNPADARTSGSGTSGYGSGSSGSSDMSHGGAARVEGSGAQGRSGMDEDSPKKNRTHKMDRTHRGAGGAGDQSTRNPRSETATESGTASGRTATGGSSFGTTPSTGGR